MLSNDTNIASYQDDCALERQKGITGQRGVAGTCIVHKVAGAAAEAGKTLDEIFDVVSEVCSQVGTLGVSLDAVTVPGAESLNTRLDDATIEIGLGIHGEAGMRCVVELQNIYRISDVLMM